MKKSLKNGFALVLLVVLPLLFWLPILVKNLAFVYRDSFNIFYAFRIYAARRMHDGKIPFWCPQIGGGTPFFANPQAALFYPPQFLSYIFPNNFGLNLEIIVHFSWAACGMYALVRCLGVTRMGAFFSGLCFAFGSLMVVSIEYLALFTVLAWVPWCWWVFLNLWHEPSSKNSARFALIWACALLGGMLDVLVMSGVCSLLLVFCRKPTGAIYSKRLAFLGVAAVLTLTLTAFQWVPFFHELQLSNRHAEGFSRGIAFWSLHPFEILGVPFALFFGGISCKWFGQLWLQGMYLGILPTALLVFLPLRKREVQVLLGAAGFFLLLSLGEYAPGVPFFLKHVPLFAHIRFPSKYFIMVLLLLGVCLGFAFDHWCNSTEKQKRMLGFTFLGVALLGVGLIWVLPHAMVWMSRVFPNPFVASAAEIWRESRSEILGVQGSVLGLSLVFLLINFHGKFRRYGAHALVFLSCVEMMLYLPFFVVTAPVGFLEKPAQNIALLNPQKNQTRIIRFDQYAAANNWYHFGSDYQSRLQVAKEGLSPLLPILHGVGFASVYQGLEPLSYTRAYRALDHELKLKNHTGQPLEVIPEWGITHGISSIPVDHPSLHLISSVPFFLYEVMPRPTLCLFKGPLPLENICEILRPSENQMRVERGPDIAQGINQLIVRERFHPNWRLRVDGVSRDIKPSAAHELGMAVKVEKGDRIFDFTYQETGWPFLAFVALGSLAVCGLVFLF